MSARVHPLRLLLLGTLWGTAAHGGQPAPPLTTAAEILCLSGEQAGQRLHVSVTGVVTAAESDWKGQFFVQDATAGIFVEHLGPNPPAPGDVVVVEGVSHPGAFAPIISSPHWRKLGTAPLPTPKAVTLDTLKAGSEDGQRVELSGIVRTARLDHDRLIVDLSVGGYHLQVNAHPPPGLAPASLIAAHIRVRGTVATHYNEALRHLTSVALYAPRLEDFIILAPERTSPFDQPVIPVNSVAQYRRGSGADQRVHVRGAVTLQRPGEELFLQDGSGGIRLESTDTQLYALGDSLDAVGFLEYENYLPVLRDAVLRRAPGRRAPVDPIPVVFAEIKSGRHQGELVTLRGRLLDAATLRVARAASNFSGFATTWILQGDELNFTAEYESPFETPALAAIPVGSTVELDGVCVSSVDVNGRLTSLKLLLPSPAGVRVLARPSWWTPERLLVGVGLLSLVLIVVFGWLLTVSRKNLTLKSLLREIEQAQRELQEAHDTLEQKVIERSAQLQVEMTARKTSELQFKAVLAERTRLARDLHDTLEQTLTGIALQLDTSAKLAERDQSAAHHHLQLARHWLRQSQVELRRSIWDLRSRELEQFDLARALRYSAEQLVDGTTMTLDFQTRGDTANLPEIIEENVLRIGQEAITNIAKHAQATRVAITLDSTPHALSLRVADNGVGFQHPADTPAAEGHYGLTGMAERAKRLGGTLSVHSQPGHGTTLTVEIPLDPAPATPAPGATPVPVP